MENVSTPHIRPCLHENATAAMRRGSAIGVLCILSFIPFLFTACRHHYRPVTLEERHEMDSIVSRVHSIDSIVQLQKQFEAEGNLFGSVVALREWGKMLRNNSRFDESLNIHSKGLKQAEALDDTIERVQALNYIGTNYRRLGVLDAAQEYHYRALRLSDACTDTSFTARKNRVKSLNGLGNIYMTIGNYERADSVLRLALAGEKALGSDVGQAINYANIGSIFRHKGQIDSAWVYYRKSMELNRKAHNDIGISLCHTYFGELYQQQKQNDKAYAEYHTAFEGMKASKDEWHALQSLLALAQIDHTMGNDARALKTLAHAEATATQIKSKEHLAEIYDLYYRIYEQQGDYRRALACHVKATSLQDSVVDIEKMNRIQNLSLSIERRMQTEEIDRVKQEAEEERAAKRSILYTSLLLILLFVSSIAFLFYSGRLRRRNHILLKKMSTLRENFFTNITHEIRTPLTVILGLSRDITAADDTPDDLKEKSRTIERQGSQLLTLINQLLDISKMKSAVGDPDWQSGNIVAQIGMTVESFRAYANSRNITLQYVNDGDVETNFVADYINKVMNNLLSNALKFTPEYGEVTVNVFHRDGFLHLSVADTGCGIDANNITHIFEPFYQGTASGHTGGTGVGLALVKQIVDTLGGTISVDSVPDSGTTFHITLPIHKPTKPARKPVAVAQPVPVSLSTSALPEDSELLDDDTPRILVIEDNADVAAYIGSRLADRYAILYAPDGNEGLKKAKELVPDLIITDLMMPHTDGLEVCRQVRDDEIINHVPIIVVTAKITEADRVAGLQAGADAYLAKPFNSDELRTRVEKLLEQRRLLREKYAQSESSGHDATPQNDADRLFLTKVTDRIYLMLNQGKDFDVEMIAAAMCMSGRQFHRKMTALTGHTPKAFLQRVKVSKARRILTKTPTRNFSEVATLCGFNDYSSFVRTFKHVCSITPTQFVRELEEQRE